MSELPEVGRTYLTIKKNVPRIVDRIEDGVIFVRAPGGSATWPVKYFWRTYWHGPTRTR